MKILSLSDLHGYLPGSLPEADVLTISGDICPPNGHHPIRQKYWMENYFFEWCKVWIQENKFKHIVFIGGNHDFILRKYRKEKTHKFYLDLPQNVHYLQDSSVDIDGIKIYGTPWSLVFLNWCFMKNEDILDEKFSNIPEGVDILLSHSPAYGIGDVNIQRPELYNGREDKHLGSKSLMKHILRAKPRYVLVGHIHSGIHEVYDIPVEGNIVKYRNVSTIDEYYKPYYTPFEFEIEVI